MVVCAAGWSKVGAASLPQLDSIYIQYVVLHKLFTFILAFNSDCFGLISFLGVPYNAFSRCAL